LIARRSPDLGLLTLLFCSTGLSVSLTHGFGGGDPTGGNVLPTELLQPAAAEPRCSAPVLQRSQHHGPRRRPRRHEHHCQQHDGHTLAHYVLEFHPNRDQDSKLYQLMG